MAGTGSLLIAALQQRNVVLRDLEAMYVSLMLQNAEIARRAGGMFTGGIDIGQDDARSIAPPAFDHIICSPPYGFETGNGITEDRLAELNDRGWTRKIGGFTWKSYTGGFRYEGGAANIGNKSGRSYWKEMRLAYRRWIELLPAGGLIVLILKNHYRRGKFKDIVGQTVVELDSMGLPLVAHHARRIDNPSHWQRIRREQGLPIVDCEDILVFQQG